MAPRIFISHSHNDDRFTQRLVKDLQAAGATVWVDSTGIQYSDFLDRINEALSQCDWFILVQTPESLKSSYVRMEVNAALELVRAGRMRAVIPVVAGHCNPKDIPPLWSTLHHYDATSGYRTALRGLVKALGLAMPAPTHHAPTRDASHDVSPASIPTPTPTFTTPTTSIAPNTSGYIVPSTPTVPTYPAPQPRVFEAKPHGHVPNSVPYIPPIPPQRLNVPPTAAIATIPRIQPSAPLSALRGILGNSRINAENIHPVFSGMSLVILAFTLVVSAILGVLLFGISEQCVTISGGDPLCVSSHPVGDIGASFVLIGTTLYTAVWLASLVAAKRLHQMEWLALLIFLPVLGLILYGIVVQQNLLHIRTVKLSDLAKTITRTWSIGDFLRKKGILLLSLITILAFDIGLSISSFSLECPTGATSRAACSYGEPGNTVGIILILLSCILLLGVWIISLINAAQASHWTWFAVIFFTRPIESLIYGAIGPDDLPKPTEQILPNSPNAPS